MKKIKGYYSIIQYCPDLGRFESVNIGVLLYCPEANFLQSRTAKSNQRIQRFFGRQAADWNRINSLKKAIEARLQFEKKNFTSLDDLQHFVSMRANLIQLTSPLPFMVEDPEKDLDQLFEELVGNSNTPRKGSPRHGGLKKVLEGQFQKAGLLDDKIIENVKVQIPVLEKDMDFPFGFQNGRFNLISPVRFQAADPRNNQKTACEYAVEGRSIFQNKHDQFGKMQLIVVGQFRPGDENSSRIVENILEESSVKLFRTEQIPELIEEIKQEGKAKSSYLKAEHLRTPVTKA